MIERQSVTSASRYDRIPRGVARYGYGEWDRALGNHRAVIRVTVTGDVAYAWLPWRRRDAFPQAKHLMIVDAQSGKTVENTVVAACNREYGEVVFEPTGGPGLYYAYYLLPMPDCHRWVWPRSSFPVTQYQTPKTTASAAWMAAHRVMPEDIGSTPDPRKVAWISNESVPAPWRDLPEAELVEFQSRGEWHSFFPMEVCATLEERLQVIERSGAKDFLLFPEKQTLPIRMTRDIPYHWASRDGEALSNFEDTAARNEYFAFQIGVLACARILPNVTAAWTDLRTAQGARIPASAITCFNLSGFDQKGKDFTKTLHVGFQEVQALWFGVDIPRAAKPGCYEGDVTIAAQDANPRTVHLRITVKNRVLADRGDGDFSRLSRLRWLNSTHAQDDEVCTPYTPVCVKGRTVEILGRTLELREDGMPERLTSFIDMFQIRDAGREILSMPVSLEAVRSGKVLSWKTTRPARCVKKTPGKAVFRATQAASGLTRSTETAVEMDGRVGVRVTLHAARALALDGLRLVLQLPADVARYWLESAPPSWVVSLNPSRLASVCPDFMEKPLADFRFAWLGDYNAGVALSMGHEPAAWLTGRGGLFRQSRQDGLCTIAVDSGALTLKAGESRAFEFVIYVTPFKPLPTEHWDWRYYHQGYGADLDVRKGVAAGARIFTQHHGSPQHPYINCPFPVAATLKETADEVHRIGGRFKAYNTIREQSTRTPELWALRSFGHEILPPCTGYLGFESMAQRPLEYQIRNVVDEPFTGQLWMCEHLVDDYHARWHSMIAPPGGPMVTEDSSLQISGASRWSNYYIESQRWLMEHAGVDGLYLDGVTFDRESFLRVRKTLVRQKPHALIDWHGSPAEILDFLAFVDSIWFGEGADYSREDAYWLVAVSGIPFGIPGELLQTEASVQRGMVYGICQRYAWMPLNRVDPSALWRWWDTFAIDQAEMLGYWMPDCPVRTSHEAVRATAYVHRGTRVAIAVGSWARERVVVQLTVDWRAVGLDPAHIRVSVPRIAMFQPALSEVSLASLPVEPGAGWIVVIEPECGAGVGESGAQGGPARRAEVL